MAEEATHVQETQDQTEAPPTGLYSEDASATEEEATGTDAAPPQEGEAQAGESEAGDTEADAEAPKGEPRTDKVRQQVQQEIANALRPIQSMLEKLTTTAETRQEQQQAQAAQEQVDEIEQALSKLNPDDVVEGKVVRALYARLKQVEGRLSQTGQAVEARNAADTYWAEWADAHPLVASQRPALLQKAMDWVAEHKPALEGERAMGAIDVRFDQLVEEAEAAAKASKGPVVPPPSKTPRKSTAGAQYVKPGASLSKPKTAPQAGADGNPPLPRMWTPDEGDE